MDSLANANVLILFGAALVLAGILSSLVASRFGAPLLLVFLVIGMLAGEEGPGGVTFNDYKTTYLVGSVALAVILFDGGLRTKLTRLRGALAPAIVLATFGVLASAALTALFAHFVLEVDWLEALLLGAMVSSTDAAAVFFLLRIGGLQLKPQVSAILEVESSTNDPVAVFLTVALTQVIVAQAAHGSVGWMIGEIARETLIGAFAGLGSGLIIVRIINSVQLPGGLHPLFVIAAAIFCYAITTLAGGSGFLAVYLAGLMVGNRPLRALPSIMGFHEAATWLSQIIMFLVLGLLVTPTRLWAYAAPGLAIAIFLIVVARPAAVWLSLQPYKIPVREKAFISWVGLRGAVSIFLAAIPTLADVPHADAFFNVAFFVVIVSLLVQGWTITPAARRLGIARPNALPAVNRVELDIPGQFEQEIAGYPILARSFALTRQSLPTWAKLVLVVRGESILNPVEAGALQAGDYAYFLTAPDRVPRLDRLFAGREEGTDSPLGPLFGELPVNGDTPLARLASLYNLDIDEEQRSFNVAALFGAEFDGAPESGDRIALGNRAILVARKVDANTVLRAGLQLEEIMETLIAGAHLRNRTLARFITAIRRQGREHLDRFTKR